MKVSTVLSVSMLVASAAAIYPPPEKAASGVDNSDMVTIQNLKDNIQANTDSTTVISGDGATLLPPPEDDAADLAGQPSKSATGSADQADDSDDTKKVSSFYSFYLAISMIVVSEIGDKTFLIAAIMAMRHPRMVVFSAAASALVLMTILSGLIGQLLPTLLSPRLTRAAAAILFLIFGVNLLREGLSTAKDTGVEEELAEVEEEIAAVEMNELNSSMEKGVGSSNVNGIDIQEKKSVDWKNQIKDLVSYISSPIWFQTFSMTFLGEWGDRSQITTIAMAAGSDYKMIILGGSLGHMICTLLAVVAGQYVSTKISLRTILLGGSVAFFIFAGLYGYDAMYE